MPNLSPSEKKAALAAREDLPKALLFRHLKQLDNDYFQEFDLAAICSHVQGLGSIQPEHPFHLKLEQLGERICRLTVLGLDYAGFLSSLTGLLSGLGYQILSAKAFTCARQPGDGMPSGHIIDSLVLEHAALSCADAGAKNQLQQGLAFLYRGLAAGDANGIREELITRIVENSRPPGLASLDASPLDVQFETLYRSTRMTVTGQDRQAVLFCLSLAMSLQGISIHKLMTSGEGREFEDQFVITGPQGGALQSPAETEPLRVAVLLMERFVWALNAASDIPSALQGLNRLIATWLPNSAMIAEEVRDNSFFLPALAKVLSSGPHIWDEVLALGPETFKQLLQEGFKPGGLSPREYYPKAWRMAIAHDSLEASSSFEILNRFRAREILKIELDFLLDADTRIEPMSDRLAALADTALASAVDLILKEMREAFGKSGPEGSFGVFGLFALGKYGSREMGSGSDLELLLLHREEESQGLRQGEFFSQAAMRLQRQWKVPQGQTFALDWRLRPHGESGPLAVLFSAWRDYMLPGGGALDYEVQALLRLRPLFGDAEFIGEVMEARDALVFRSPPLPIDHTLSLRQKLEQTKTKAGLFNAKYSKGGMVDVEYAVQFLQLSHGRQHAQVRHPSVTRALEGLLEVGVLSLAEFEHLFTAFLFLRRLQGHLRLVRGLARDLDVPKKESPEFRHLARRMGYSPHGGYKVEWQLENDLGRYREAVSGFFNHRFLHAEKPALFYSSLAQNLMDDSCGLEEAEPALRRMGMRQLPQAQGLFLELFATVVEKRILAAVLLMAEERFFKHPDPDYALRQLTRFLQAAEHPDVLVQQMLHHPPLLHALLALFGHSLYLSDALLREPQWVKDLMRPGALTDPRDFKVMVAEALEMARGDTLQEKSAGLCRFRDKEYLRIALRDIYLQVHLQRITREITTLSDALITIALQAAFAPWEKLDAQTPWALIAMGKLGGQELNYSSDIDLIFIRGDMGGEDQAGQQDQESDKAKAFDAHARAFIAMLSTLNPGGKLFRVDMNLRPWGRQGYLSGTEAQYRRYYEEEAQGWELQAWLKARCMGGRGDLGPRFIAGVQALAWDPVRREAITASMRKVRHRGLEILQKEKRLAGEVKLGPGGIRTVEFFTQALQIKFGKELPEILTGNTLEALGRLQRFQILTPHQYRTLAAAYVFLRRVEHRLQMLEMRQEHELPGNPGEMEKLAKRMGYEPRLGQDATSGFLDHYRKHMFALLALSEQLFDY